MKEKKEREEGFEKKRPVNNIKYFREASEVGAGSTYWIIQLVILKESSYSREVGVEVRLV